MHTWVAKKCLRSILAIMVSNRVWFLLSRLELCTFFFQRNYIFCFIIKRRNGELFIRGQARAFSKGGKR